MVKRKSGVKVTLNIIKSMFLLFVFLKFLMIQYSLVLYPKKILFFDVRKDISAILKLLYCPGIDSRRVTINSQCPQPPCHRYFTWMLISVMCLQVHLLTTIDKTKQIVLCFL